MKRAADEIYSELLDVEAHAHELSDLFDVVALCSEEAQALRHLGGVGFIGSRETIRLAEKILAIADRVKELCEQPAPVVADKAKRKAVKPKGKGGRRRG
jgi:hypothetical protein